jgi:MSHA biogenesis protein MshL
MKYIFNVLFLSSAVLLSGCQTVAPIGGTTAQQEGVAAIEEAITNNEKNEVIPAPPSAPLGLLPPLNFDAGHGGSGERFDITAEALPARDFFMGLVQGTSYNMIVHEEVGGTVSLALKDVTVDEVMRAIQRVYGYEYSRDGNLYQVLPASLQTQIFHKLFRYST